MLLCLPAFLPAQVRCGAERKELYYPLLKDRKVGIVANQASVAFNANIVDVLVKDGFQIGMIFSPEHGFRLSGDAGQTINTGIDSATGIRVVSLYGDRRKPAREDIDSLDVVVFDIQDVGVRFYTYISTLSYVMEACAENRVPLIVLDRPNPNGFYIDGPVLEKSFSSFVGMHPVPVVYGMTIGEYARMVNGEGWLKNGIQCDLKVVPLENYTAKSRYQLHIKPSPNLSNPGAIALYPSLCFFEGTCVSVGRGTSFPFQVYGHPMMDSGRFAFTPKSMPGASLHPPFENKVCHGEDLRSFYAENPAESGKINLAWLIKACHSLKGKTVFFNDYFNKLAGNSALQKQVAEGKTEKEIRQSWKAGITKFRKVRAKYLLYYGSGLRSEI